MEEGKEAKEGRRDRKRTYRDSQTGSALERAGSSPVSLSWDRVLVTITQFPKTHGMMMLGQRDRGVELLIRLQ